MKTPNGVLRLLGFDTTATYWEWNGFTDVFVPAARLPYARYRYQINRVELYCIYEGQGRIHTLYDPAPEIHFCKGRRSLPHA